MVEIKTGGKKKEAKPKFTSDKNGNRGPPAGVFQRKVHSGHVRTFQKGCDENRGAESKKVGRSHLRGAYMLGSTEITEAGIHP